MQEYIVVKMSQQDIEKVLKKENRYMSIKEIADKVGQSESVTSANLNRLIYWNVIESRPSFKKKRRKMFILKEEKCLF